MEVTVATWLLSSNNKSVAASCIVIKTVKHISYQSRQYYIPFSTIFHTDTSTCRASGDPHYTTFDHRNYDFMGNCSYVMSKPCKNTSMPYFEVHADNENRYKNRYYTVSWVEAVHVYVDMLKISILRGGTVQVR